MKSYFITGIDTNVGKTIVSAIITEALEADYWKPIQAGDLDNSDSINVRNLISNSKSIIHKERYKLNTPASPHLAAKLDGIDIKISDFELPKTNNHLVVEGAGGLLVPINEKGDLIIDLIKYLDVEVILVSKHYLGSINHTLLSLKVLRSEGVKVKGIVFVGDENKATESIIKQISGVNILGRIPLLNTIDKESILAVAQHFKTVL